jgi:hypothetical protein
VPEDPLDAAVDFLLRSAFTKDVSHVVPDSVPRPSNPGHERSRQAEEPQPKPSRQQWDDDCQQPKEEILKHASHYLRRSDRRKDEPVRPGA